MASKKSTRANAKARILIVDDHPMMRQGLAQLVNNEPDLAVCCEVENAHQALAAIDQDPPDLVLADITLPDKSGIELIKDIQAIHPGLAVLVISMHDESLYAERVLRAGGRGYIMKQEGGKKIMQGIRQVLAGETCVSQAISSQIVDAVAGRRKPAASPVETLTDREFEVFQLIGQGRVTKEIAEQLHVSVKTVEVHRV